MRVERSHPSRRTIALGSAAVFAAAPLASSAEAGPAPPIDLAAEKAHMTPRLAAIPAAEMTPLQHQVFDQGIAAGRHMSGPPYIAYMRNPGYLGLHVQAMSNLFDSPALPARLRQIINLVTVRFWDSVFPSEAQRQPSLDAGLSPAIVDAIGRGEEPPLTDPKDIAAYKVCTQLLKKHRVDDKTYADALEALGETTLVTLVIGIGMLSTTCMTCNLFQLKS